MNIFSFRRQVVEDYADYTRSFIQILDPRLNAFVDEQLRAGVLWPEPLIQLNPSFEPGAWIDDLVNQAVLHRECGRVFRIKPQAQDEGRAPSTAPSPGRSYPHCTARAQLRPDDWHRLGQEPGLHRADRGPRATQG